MTYNLIGDNLSSLGKYEAAIRCYDLMITLNYNQGYDYF